MPRDETWFDTLLELLELERRAGRERLAQDRATLSLDELEARGRVLLDLEATESSWGLGGRALVTLRRADGRPLATQLSPGDVVQVSPRKADVDAPPQALVSRSTRQTLQLAFDRPPPPFVHEGRLKLEVVDNDVTWQRVRSAVQTVQSAEKTAGRRRRELLLGAGAPRTGPVVPHAAHRPLNAEQEAALRLALQAEELALVHGPPGTGKSHVLVEVAVAEARRGRRLLCTAASNAAVDHLLELCVASGLRAVRVGHPARVLPHLVQHTLDELVEGQPDREVARELFDEAFELQGYARRQRTQGRSRARFSNAREAQSEARRLLDEARALERKAVDAVLGRAQVVCATLATALGERVSALEFDVALVDEATQATEPLTLAAFLRAPKVVLAGDPRQLPPTVLSLDAQRRGLARSLFERLQQERPEVSALLKEQHRMAAPLMAFPSRASYGGQLRAHPAAAERTLADVLPGADALDAAPLLLVDTAGRGFDESTAPGTASLRNEGEARLLERRARALLAAGLPQAELAVISPYRAQADFLRELLADAADVEVDTIDAFQGREKDVVLLSLVRSSGEGGLGFLADLRRANVALTRARRQLFVVGDSATLAVHDYYRQLVEEAQAQGGYRSAWEWPDAEGL